MGEDETLNCCREKIMEDVILVLLVEDEGILI